MRSWRRSWALGAAALAAVVTIGIWLPHSQRTVLIAADEYGDSAGNLMPVQSNPDESSDASSMDEVGSSAQQASYPSSSEAATNSLLPVPWVADKTSQERVADPRESLFRANSYGSLLPITEPEARRKISRDMEALHTVTQAAHRGSRLVERKMGEDSHEISKKFPNFFKSRKMGTLRAVKLPRTKETQIRSLRTEEPSKDIDTSPKSDGKDWNVERARLEQEAKAADAAAADDDADAAFWSAELLARSPQKQREIVTGII